MVVRGVYTAAEEQMLADWKRIEKGGPVWVGDEDSPENPFPVHHRTATKDLILDSANGIGDRNPLWRDDNYAGNTRWGRIIAPPLFPFTICVLIGRGPVKMLRVPPEIGTYTEFTTGYRCEFYKPIYQGDSFKVRDNVACSIEDTTNPDGNGPRTFNISNGRKFINQKDEVVCIIHNKRSAAILPPEHKGPVRRGLPMLPMTEYIYSREELDFIDHIYNEEEIRGADMRYWEDVNTGDMLKPVVVGPVTVWDQVLGLIGRGASTITNSMEMRKHKPKAMFVDPSTGVSHKGIEFGLADRTARLIGAKTALIGVYIVEDALCRTITNWMGDDGFLRMFDSHYCANMPVGDTFFCRGKVINKRTENGEHLVDVIVWAEDIRGYIADWAAATVSLYSKHAA